jgi:hypothetical protein
MIFVLQNDVSYQDVLVEFGFWVKIPDSSWPCLIKYVLYHRKTSELEQSLEAYCDNFAVNWCNKITSYIHRTEQSWCKAER